MRIILLGAQISFIDKTSMSWFVIILFSTFLTYVTLLFEANRFVKVG